MSPSSEIHNAHQADRLLYGGLLGLCVAGVLQLVETDLTLPLHIAVYSFAMAIPLLTGCFLAEMDRVQTTNPPPPSTRLVIAGLSASFLSLVGFAACFWHFGIGPVAVFLLFVFLSLALVRSARR